MRAAAAYNKPSNTLEPSPISSLRSFILTLPHPLPLTLTAAKDTQPRGARAPGAWAKAQAPNRNQPPAAGRPGTHFPSKMASNRPSFLIHCPELDTELSSTKQKLAPISNRQFFAFLKLPDTLLGVSPRPAKRLRRVRQTPRKSRHPTAKRERLIGNDMHSPASATALQCVSSIFLIGNEFRFAECEFSAHFRATAKAASSRRTPKKKSLTLTNRAWGNPANEEQHLRRPGLKPRHKRIAGSSSYRAPYPRERFRSAWIWTRLLRSTFAFRPLARRCFLRFAAFGLTIFDLVRARLQPCRKTRQMRSFLSRVSSARTVPASCADWFSEFRFSIFDFRLFGFSR